MARVFKDTATRVTEVRGAWARMRPGKKFFGKTLEQFELDVKPFLDAGAELEELYVLVQHAESRRETAEVAARKAVQSVVNAVKGDPEEGEDGELYSAMGYVPKSKRSTGLKRPRKEEPPKSGGSAA